MQRLWRGRPRGGARSERRPSIPPTRDGSAMAQWSRRRRLRISWLLASSERLSKQSFRGSIRRGPARVAQGIERRFPKPCVAGSNPAVGAEKSQHSRGFRLQWQGFWNRPDSPPFPAVSRESQYRASTGRNHPRVVGAGLPRATGRCGHCRSRRPRSRDRVRGDQPRALLRLRRQVERRA